ncbi:hypothetical protein E1B28_010890 [Marasmius oreades]|uniref:Uncharacterized protein n=1 Tax=Marasmius oreades TaxID=181124 RepID=A0A9P7RUC0_9AGAR|nr:uncharacterized protein E1B28_010890 [Marasmius oreades]KAG7089188.1 hypothetical protein E1B28_010890 [Marasmius oreades]
MIGGVVRIGKAVERATKNELETEAENGMTMTATAVHAIIISMDIEARTGEGHPSMEITEVPLKPPREGRRACIRIEETEMTTTHPEVGVGLTG